MTECAGDKRITHIPYSYVCGGQSKPCKPLSRGCWFGGTKAWACMDGIMSTYTSSLGRMDDKYVPCMQKAWIWRVPHPIYVRIPGGAVWFFFFLSRVIFVSWTFMFITVTHSTRCTAVVSLTFESFDLYGLVREHDIGYSGVHMSYLQGDLPHAH